MHHHGSTASSLISSHQQPAAICCIRHIVSSPRTFRTELLTFIMTIATITKVLLLLAFLTLGVSGEEKLRGRRPGEQQTERKIQACDKASRLKVAQWLANRPGGSGGGTLPYWCWLLLLLLHLFISSSYYYHLRFIFVDFDFDSFLSFFLGNLSPVFRQYLLLTLLRYSLTMQL